MTFVVGVDTSSAAYLQPTTLQANLSSQAIQGSVLPQAFGYRGLVEEIGIHHASCTLSPSIFAVLDF